MTHTCHATCWVCNEKRASNRSARYNEVGLMFDSSALGSARASDAESLEFARKRVAFGKPIGSFQLVRKEFATMDTEINYDYVAAPLTTKSALKIIISSYDRVHFGAPLAKPPVIIRERRLNVVCGAVSWIYGQTAPSTVHELQHARIASRRYCVVDHCISRGGDLAPRRAKSRFVYDGFPGIGAQEDQVH